MLKKAIFERALVGELTHHLGYEKGEVKPTGSTNHRNSTSRKRILTDDDTFDVEIPRDCEGTFDPVLISKGSPSQRTHRRSQRLAKFCQTASIYS